MVAVKVIGESFSLLLGCEAKSAFEFSNNPIAGLMVGVVATALLHSSSTVTSVTVALVGAKGLTVRQGVPIVMGANVGTCITCIMVAFAQVGKREQFERAMAAATVHDMYNIWSVIVLFPIELLFHPLELLSVAMAGGKSSFDFKSPTDAVVNPLADLIVKSDRSMIEKVSTGKVTCEKAVFLRSGMFFDSVVKNKTMSNATAGGICAAIGFVMLVLALVALVHMLSKLFRGPTQHIVRKMLNYNGYLNILIGTAITFSVHSSTVVTSMLTPMAGLDLVSLEQVYPIVIGANLGTTATALLASWVSGKSDAVAIALVHFWFNVWGIFLFYPIPITRYPILQWARRFAFYSARWPPVAVWFLVLLFVVVPGTFLGLTFLFQGESVAIVFGVVTAVVLVAAVLGFYWWYFKKGGRAKWHAFLEAKGDAYHAREAAKNGAANDHV
ncbi:hypothetical protein H310_13896 [Aphanomyces invadans]|uniref:Sodium-dependent phosphate transporter n=2 Tax=Aphanomyces invadans TaxID=157072 RepID=A0A024TBW0_9STRA|nr:hypothetical protein H310_13896 [Aphanomyces invadans]ETV91650.1 hypothetical protein H310_13896 [Aphanomyces invadans]|eukprot:XP_008879769.1 hypothetical protein H310_13896 [Aphanomyces invadans]